MNNLESTTKELESSSQNAATNSTPTVTAPTITKQKDPKRVARGKKLAEISKDYKKRAKERNHGLVLTKVVDILAQAIFLDWLGLSLVLVGCI